MLHVKTSQPVTWDQAESLIRQRPDIPNGLVVAARSIGASCLAALAKTHPTPKESEWFENEDKRALQRRDTLGLAERAAMVKRALGAEWGDATRLEVFNAVHEVQAAVDLLAQAWERHERRDPMRGVQWARAVHFAEQQKVRAAIFAAHKLCVQAEQQEKRRPRRRKARKR